MLSEKWRIIKFNRNLAISNLGRLKTIKTDQIWKIGITRNGYNQITLYIPKIKKSKSFKIHRLVAEYFLPKIHGKTHINHKDFNKLNNSVSNLEWCTPKENVRHYYEKKFKYPITPDGVLFIRKNIDAIGVNKLAEILNINVGYVMNVANGSYFGNIHKEFIRDKKPSLPKRVNKYDTNGLLIKKYPSIKSAAKDVNSGVSKIQRVLSGERKLYHGFVYKYAT